MNINPQFLQPYFDGKKRHAAYNDSVKMYRSLAIHANGEFPDKLVHERRPSESDEILSYREKIYEPVTKDSFKRILTSLNKIRRSSDWSVQYDADKQPVFLPQQDLPYNYTEVDFPYHSSLSNWLFTVLLKNYLVDPNAVVMVLPLQCNVASNEFLKPFPLVFNSDKVLEYVDGELAILQSEEEVEYKYGSSVRYDGEVYYVVTREYVQRWQQHNSKREFVLAEEFVHGLDALPAFRLWADFYKSYGLQKLSESRISSIVPRLNEMLREYSDLQAGVVNHLYPEAWEWSSVSCDACSDGNGKSTGTVKHGKSLVACSKCHGTGMLPSSGPYRKMIIRGTNANMGEQDVPIPPKGYIQKDVEIIKVQDERIDKHQYAALASINMQFLLQTPTNQSGYAKEVDKDELNHFVYGVAEDLVAFMDKLYKLIIDYRYRLVVPDAQQRAAMLPMVAVPEKFDLLSLTYLLEELTKAISAKVSSAIIITMLKEYVAKKFYNNAQLRDTLTCILELDPLACLSEEDKVTRKQNGGITDIDYIISSNIQSFVQRAMNEHKDFVKMGLSEKRKVMEGFAGKALEVITSITKQPAV